MQGHERRMHPRVNFSSEDGVSVLLERSSPDGSESMLVHARMLSLSAGGMSFIGKSPALMNLQEGDQLMLVRVTEPKELAFLQHITLEIRHAINQEETDHILSGCSFLNVNAEQQAHLSRYVEQNLDEDET